MNWLRHPVAARLRALASVGQVADADDIAELKLGPVAAKRLTEASERCAALYEVGNHAGASQLAEEFGPGLVGSLPASQRSESYLNNRNRSLVGLDPRELADLVPRGNRG